MNFESLIRYKALNQRYIHLGHDVGDQVNEGLTENAEKLGLKKLQFLVSTPLHDQVRETCNYLQMSMREFLEAVVVDAVGKASQIIHEENAGPESLGYPEQEGNK